MSKRYKILKYLLILQVVGLLSAVILYRVFGPSVLTRILEGGVFPFISVLPGENIHFAYYLARADILFVKLILVLVLAVLAQAGLVVLLRDRLVKTDLSGSVVRAVPLKSILMAGAVLLILLYSGRYHHVAKDLSKQGKTVQVGRDFSLIDDEDMIQLGWDQRWIDRVPENSYLVRKAEKEKGVFRIGIFGDSFVMGEDCDPGKNVATLLEARFMENGYDNVEVINFGVSAYGMHQAYLLYETLHERYDLDFAVFMPFPWSVGRDSTFLFDIALYGPVHARYILKDGRLEIVPVAGVDGKEAADIYNRIFPPWRYLRYDIRIPFFFRVILPPVLESAPNVLYYAPIVTREILKTYTAIFDRIVTDKTGLLVYSGYESIFMAGSNAAKSSDSFYRSMLWDRFRRYFYYRTVYFHNSALGNQAVANELFSVLASPDGEGFVDVISVTGVPGDGSFTGEERPLNEYDVLTVNIDEYPLASLVYKSTVKISSDSERDFMVDIHGSDAASLVLLSPERDGGIVASVLFSRLLKDKEDVFLMYKARGREYRKKIGIIDSGAGTVGRLEFDPAGSEEGESDEDCEILFKHDNLYLNSSDVMKEIRVLVGDDILLRGVDVSGKRDMGVYGPFAFLANVLLGRNVLYKLVPEGMQDLVIFRAYRENVCDIDDLPGKGTIDIVLYERERAAQRIPFLEYEIVPVRVKRPEGMPAINIDNRF